MKHKHYDLIVAGAAGKQLQYKVIRRVEDWRDIPFNLIDWGDSSLEYRIKPEAKLDVIKQFYLQSDPLFGLWFSAEDMPAELRQGAIFAVISCTFDGETDRLKKAEVL
jgi:hypothetical protein